MSKLKKLQSENKYLQLPFYVADIVQINEKNVSETRNMLVTEKGNIYGSSDFFCIPRDRIVAPIEIFIDNE